VGFWYDGGFILRFVKCCWIYDGGILVSWC